MDAAVEWQGEGRRAARTSLITAACQRILCALRATLAVRTFSDDELVLRAGGLGEDVVRLQQWPCANPALKLIDGIPWRWRKDAA